MNRRQFLKGSAAAIAAPWIIPGTALGQSGPSSKITVGLIGNGLMGGGHLHRMANDPGVRVLAVCDVDASRRERAKGIIETTYAADRASGAYSGCAAYNDYRDLLARTDIDAVVIVTPDHWHAFQSIDAAKAGKDVYCEKPVSVTIDEGRQLVRVMQRYGRVFQTGTQYRSIPTVRAVCQFVREGGLGKVRRVFTLLDPLYWFIAQPRFQKYHQGMDIDRQGKSYAARDFDLPGEPVPPGLDWNLWVGPAPWHPYNSVYHINPSPGVVPWSFCDAFGTASITWHLSHSADVIQYALGMERTGPVEIIHPSAGLYPTITARYANGTLLHFVDHWGLVKDAYKALPADARLAGNFGGIFVGERGWITSMSTGGPVEGGPPSIFEELALRTRDVNIGANDHHANWLDCIRTRRTPSCDAEIGHRGASLGHLALLTDTLGRSLKWNAATEQVIGDEEANRLLSRPAREPWRLA